MVEYYRSSRIFEVYQIPPEGKKIPDALLYWGGDEYNGPVELSLNTSDWMKEKGIAYHINMLATHPITKEQVDHIIKENGHEISQYYGLNEEDRFIMKEEYYREENDLFYKKFWFRPVCTVNKWLGWKGWAEPAKWMRQAGGRADNSFFGSDVSFEHPLGNGPFFGFGSGTSYPFYFYDDYAGENQRIDFLEEPIVCYEIGHRGSIHGDDPSMRGDAMRRDTETLVLDNDTHFPIDLAVRYHLLMNMFYHPAYVATYPPCREAIEEILNYIHYKNALVTHMGNDQVWAWWGCSFPFTSDRCEGGTRFGVL